MVWIPRRLLNIEAFNRPAESLTLRYLGDKFFWKNVPINNIIGIGTTATKPINGDT